MYLMKFITEIWRTYYFRYLCFLTQKKKEAERNEKLKKKKWKENICR